MSIFNLVKKLKMITQNIETKIPEPAYIFSATKQTKIPEPFWEAQK